MMRKKIYKKVEQYQPCIFFSIIFGYYMYKTSIFGDDAAFIQVGMNFRNIVGFLVERYNIWSSRIFIETVTIIVSQTSLSFSLFSGFSILVLLYSIINLALEDGHIEPKKFKFVQIITIFIVMLYPFIELSNAGWRATLGNYYFLFVMAFSPLLF